MSMSQEEIESLMNGIDLDEDQASADAQDASSVVEEESDNSADMSENDIADLIAQTDLSEETTKSETESSLKNEDLPKEEAEVNVEDILNEASENTNTEESEPELDVDSLLKELDESEAKESQSENIDDILASIENMDSSEADITSSESDTQVKTVENKEAETKKVDVKKEEVPNETSGKEWAESKIQEGVFPFPADQDTKVVSQLSEVANDTEEKSLQIFDVLSLVLDNNDEASKGLKQSEDFVQQQILLLSKLSSKFPNISEFSENLNVANDISSTNKNLLKTIDEENMKIFEAMELMQFNDINRQKIERVMSVIRKLSSYLNNLFEDDTPENEIIVAKHIHGDNSDDLLANEDLESLISEFSN